jgi:hypothetical protein
MITMCGMSPRLRSCSRSDLAIYLFGQVRAGFGGGTGWHLLTLGYTGVWCKCGAQDR